MKQFLLMLVLCFWGLTSFAVAQSTAQEDDGKEEEVDETKERAKRLYGLFAETAESLEMQSATKEKPFRLEDKPLFTFASAGTVFGSVYVWFDSEDRLAVVGTIGSLPINEAEYEFVELHLLKPAEIQPVTFSGFPSKKWFPEVESLRLQPIADAPQVSANESGRLVQMRGLARQFSGEMIQGDQINQLRLLPQPLYRYPKSTRDRDGALFALVWDKGTDPEVLLRIESVDSADGKPTWHYQAIRFTWRAVNLSHRNVKVWSKEEFVDRDNPNQPTPYITGITKMIP